MRKTSDTQINAVEKNDIDLTGMRFGKLVVVQATEDRKHGYVVWKCQCDCGNTVLVSSSALERGNKKSCGCLNIKDLSGQRFGQLIAIRATEDRKHGSVVWECQCDCGNLVNVPSSNLTNGKKKSCGCLETPKLGIKDLTGQRFWALTAIRPTDERLHRAVVWECQCVCGNTVFATAQALIHGEKKSCGCAIGKPIKDLTGERFGILTVLSPTEERKNGRIVWECLCDCGNTAFVQAGSLVGGGTRSCGCLRKIKGKADVIRFGDVENIGLKNRVLQDDTTLTIKDLRIAANMTQAEFSTYFGIPKRTIEDWETGRRKFPQYLLPLIRYKLVSENLIN